MELSPITLQVESTKDVPAVKATRPAVVHHGDPTQRPSGRLLASSSEHPLLDFSDVEPLGNDIDLPFEQLAEPMPVRTITIEPGKPLAPGLVTSHVLHALSWLLIIGTAFFYAHAKPESHKIDRFFGVVRGRDWDSQWLAVALVLSGLGVLAALISVLLGYLDPDEKRVRPGPVVAALSALVAVIVVAIRF